MTVACSCLMLQLVASLRLLAVGVDASATAAAAATAAALVTAAAATALLSQPAALPFRIAPGRTLLPAAAAAAALAASAAAAGDGAEEARAAASPAAGAESGGRRRRLRRSSGAAQRFAAGSNASRCWSRSERQQYYKAETQRWSRALKTRVRAYTRMQQRCMANVDGFDSVLFRRHQQENEASEAESNGTSTATDGCSFLVFLPKLDTGVGNNVLSLVSAFTAALLMNRSLVVPRSSFAAQHLCNPFGAAAEWAVDVPDALLESLVERAKSETSQPAKRQHPDLQQQREQQQWRQQLVDVAAVVQECGGDWRCIERDVTRLIPSQHPPFRADLHLHAGADVREELETGVHGGNGGGEEGGDEGRRQLRQVHGQALVLAPLLMNFVERIPHLFCESSWHVLESSRATLVVSGNQYFVPALYLVPKLAAELQALVPSRRVFTHVARVLLNPANHLWRTITRNFHTIFDHHSSRVGIQVRQFDADGRAVVPPRVMACAVRIAGYLPPPPPSPHEQSATAVSVQSEWRKGSVGVLVTSLHRSVAEYMRAAFAPDTTDSEQAVSVYSLSEYEKQRNRQEEQKVQAMVEMWLLSMCDYIMTTDVSTFGYVAAGLAGVQPYSMNIVVRSALHIDFRDGSDGRDVCELAPSEPCFHDAAPLHQLSCAADDGAAVSSDQSPSALKRLPSFMRPCVGLPYGIAIQTT